MSNTVIDIQNLSKKYVIRQKQSSIQASFREDITAGIRNLGKRLINPFDNQNAQYTKEDFWALKDISLQIQQGERVGIIGRNGAGKSTLLKILSRITTPTEGQAVLKGRVASLLEVGTGFHSELTGRENIFLNGSILGMSHQEIRRKFDEIVAFAEIEQFLDTPVKRYSSGMYVRLAFAIAAHLEPEILIVDEVLAVGDIEFQKKCMGKMEKIGEEGRTVLFVSHNTASITRLCDSCVFLEQGKLISQGPTQSVIRDYLASNLAGGNEYLLPEAPEQEMALRKVILNPEAKQATTDIRYDESFTIRIEYDINKPIENATVWLALQTIDGIVAFVTADYDMDPSKLGDRKPGHYVADVHFPEKWLNVGEYVVLAGLVKNNPVEVFHREETLTFRVEEIGTPGSILMPGQRKGVLQPYLEWTDVK